VIAREDASRPGSRGRRGTTAAALASLALASCSSTQLGSGEVSSLVPQILGLLILAWLVLLFV